MKPTLAQILFESRQTIFRTSQDLAQFAHYRHIPGWLRITRDTLGFKSRDLAHQIGISPATYSEFETRELTGDLTIKTLQTAAEAMDCELVYFIRPKDGKTYAQRVWEELEDDARAKANRSACPEHMRQHQLAAVASELFANPKYRREKGWGPLKRKRKPLSFAWRAPTI